MADTMSVHLKGRKGSPSPYNFCYTTRSEDEEEDLHSDGHDINSGSEFQCQCDNPLRDVRKGSNNEKGRSLEQLGTPLEHYEGMEENAYNDSFYGPLYRKPLTVEESDAPLDIENMVALWAPPPPEDEADEVMIGMGDDEDEDGEDGWGSSHSLGGVINSEHINREKGLVREQKKAVGEVVREHFQVLVAQLLQGEGIQSEKACQKGWVEIVTALSLEASNFVKPDTSTSGGMDPGSYVKVKYVASGEPIESQVVKGIVCKKNVAHRRMPSTYKCPRLLLLGGALEFQEHLASLRTMLNKETDHLSTAVSRIEACHPNVLLVEKNVSGKAQEQLLAKDVSLVLNVKRPLLERIARCTGTDVIPTVDHLSVKSAQQLGFCELFHVKKFVEEHDSAGQEGKKLTKTLMFFEGCPKPLGCTILLKGENSKELKKVKRAVQFSVFAAYHLARETSFLADEGANLPELRLRSPLSVVLPDRRSKSDMSISMVSEFLSPASSKQKSNLHINDASSIHLEERVNSSLQPPSPSAFTENSLFSLSRPTSPVNRLFTGQEASSYIESTKSKMSSSNSILSMTPEDIREGYFSSAAKALIQKSFVNDGENKLSLEVQDQEHNMEKSSFTVAEMKLDAHTKRHGEEYTQEDFPPSPSDHQSILVSFSSTCLRRGTVCERGHLFRIKYYSTFDKPLGRFLRDTVFDLTNLCSSCGEPRNAHVDCYTHKQGSLKISVKQQDYLLPGESEGKIWMWHRCLKCPRMDGLPPVTCRLVMSDAAWGLSFGKFLELSFSNHAAASRVASCGHSLHHDCLRFYGFGRLVACFRYSLVIVYSVSLPPKKLEFHYSEHQEWLQQEVQEITEKGELCFKDIQDHLHEITQSIACNNSNKASEVMSHVAELERLAVKQKTMFKAALHCAVSSSNHRKDEPHIDILQLNYIRSCLFKCSSKWLNWLQRLLQSRKTETYANLLLGDSLIPSLQTISFGVGQTCKSDDQDAFTTIDDTSPGSSHDSIEFSYKGLQLLKVSDSLAGYEIASLSDAGPSTESSGLYVVEGLENGVIQTSSKGQFSTFGDISANFNAAWTGTGQSLSESSDEQEGSVNDAGISAEGLENGHTRSTSEASNDGSYQPLECLSSQESEAAGIESELVPTLVSPAKSGEPSDIVGWVGEPCSELHNTYGVSTIEDAHFEPSIVPRSNKAVMLDNVKVCFPIALDDTMVSIHDDEPTSAIAFAIISQEHKVRVCGRSAQSVSDLYELSEIRSLAGDKLRPDVFEEREDTIGNDKHDDSSLFSEGMHVKISFTDNASGKVGYTVTCYYAKQFDSLRRKYCPNAMDFIRSLCHCKKWGAQGGKSHVFFAKTFDDRFVVKQVTKTELESFMTFAPSYFKYMSEALASGSPTCLAKILGIYQVIVKNGKIGEKLRMDLMIMENLLYERHVTRIYDLKGSLRSRYNSDVKGKDAVLLDQNLLESMQTNPIFISNKSKRLLERAVWNDTSFLASADVMDYSLLVGIDEEHKELVLGIIDFMRQYTWDKHLETWVKASGILGGPKNTQPTIISPQQYKKRFRKAMSTYFLMVPDQWSPLTVQVEVPHVTC